MNGSFVLRIINYCPRGVNASNLMIAPNPAGNIRTCGRGHIKVLPNLLLFELRFYIRYCCSRVTKSTTVHTIPSQLTGWMAAASLLHQIGPPAQVPSFRPPGLIALIVVAHPRTELVAAFSIRLTGRPVVGSFGPRPCSVIRAL